MHGSPGTANMASILSWTSVRPGPGRDERSKHRGEFCVVVGVLDEKTGVEIDTFTLAWTERAMFATSNGMGNKIHRTAQTKLNTGQRISRYRGLDTSTGRGRCRIKTQNKAFAVVWVGF